MKIDHQVVRNSEDTDDSNDESVNSENENSSNPSSQASGVYPTPPASGQPSGEGLPPT